MTAADFDRLLSGRVRANEAYVGDRRSGGKRGRGAPGKTIVIGMKDEGGPLVTKVIPDIKNPTLRAVVNENAEGPSRLYGRTDELRLTGRRWLVNGSVKDAAKEWSRFDRRQVVTHFANAVEGFWRLFKASVRSTHVQIGSEHMECYLGEFTSR